MMSRSGGIGPYTPAMRSWDAGEYDDDDEGCWCWRWPLRTLVALCSLLIALVTLCFGLRLLPTAMRIFTCTLRLLHVYNCLYRRAE